jgi:2-dehydro-3-deoxygluconokinase
MGAVSPVPEFLTIGEPLVALASDDIDIGLDKVEHFTKFLAGAEFNVALGVRRLGHSAGYLAKVGADPFGRFIVDSARSAGLEESCITVDKQFLTGFYVKGKVSHGDPTTAYFRKNSAAANMTARDIASIDIEGVKIAHLSGIFAALSATSLATFEYLNRQLVDKGILTVFDPNLRPVLWETPEKMIRVTNELAKRSQIILPGIEEARTLTERSEPEAIADFYLARSELTHTVVVKLGAAGAYAKQRSGESLTIPGFHVERVVDTVGAGDGFAVGLETALLEGKPLDTAVRRACAIGALQVQTRGDNDGFPTREQLHNFYEKNK